MLAAAGEDNLICDLAETYGVLNYRALPVSLLATLSAGLRENSRCRMALSKMKVTTDTFLLAAAVDKLALLVWSKSEDARRGRNRPQSLVRAIMGEAPREHSDILSFDSGEDFEAARARILNGVTDHGD